MLPSRTSVAAVWGVLQPEDRPDPDYDLEPFIDAAVAIVGGGFAPLAEYPETTLELIERFLAAHFFVTSRIGKSGVTRVEIMDAAESYATGADVASSGELTSTGYGRVALALSNDELDQVGKPAARVLHVA